MAVNGAWPGEHFGEELAAILNGILAETQDVATLQRAVAVCASSAEAACAGRKLSCMAGCPHCCVLNVAILLPEGLTIAGWLQDRLAASELHGLQRHLARHRCWTRWMDDEERITKQAICPFLDGAGCCIVHPVRPLVCRAISSWDRDGCMKAFDPILTDRSRLVPTDLMRQAVHDAAFLALAKALGGHGFDNRSIELGTGVLAFLEVPELAGQLISGQRLPDSLWEYPA